MMKPRIGVVISSTREGRFGDKPANWIKKLGTLRGDLDFEIIDLRDYVLPLLGDEADSDAPSRWSAQIDGMDGFIFITAEYNHSITGALKNALDYSGDEFHRKPASFVGYGGVGGARAVEHLRMIAVELQIAPLRNGVHIAMDPYMGVTQGGKQFDDYPFLVESANSLLDELAWWTRVLKSGRDANVSGAERSAAKAA